MSQQEIQKEIDKLERKIQKKIKKIRQLKDLISILLANKID